jgi:hypothetical protein
MTDPNVPFCTHIHVNGNQCRVPALRGRTLCHFHDENEKRRRLSARLARRLADRNRRTVNIPLLEDPNAVQVALQETIYAFLDKRLDHKDASLLFYALQTASANAKSLKIAPETPTWSVRQELFKRRSKLYEQIFAFEKWEERERGTIRQQLEKEFQAKLEAMKKPPASETPAPATATQ